MISEEIKFYFDRKDIKTVVRFVMKLLEVKKR